MKSAYCVYIESRGSKLYGSLAGTSILTTLSEDATVAHVNGDRECGKTIKGYKLKIAQRFGIAPEFDDSFLNFL